MARFNFALFGMAAICFSSILSRPAVAAPIVFSNPSSYPPQINHDPTLVTVEGFLLAKVIYSNFVTLRPGSVYDMRYHFEQNLGLQTPTFNYLFSDLGLGTAEPLYAMFQSGHQGSYEQLIQSGDEKTRHLDHFSDMVTPDGCRIQSVYIVRDISQYPDLYAEERAQGYTIVDASWNYTTRIFPGAQCGHHRANDPDPSFDPIQAIKPYLKHFRTMDDIPPELLARYEAKVNLEKVITQKLYWPLDWEDKRPDASYEKQYSFKDNSLWYYPDGHDADYGISTPRSIPGLQYLNRPSQFILPSTPSIVQALPLSQVLSAENFGKYADFLWGRPVPDYDLAQEPGGDILSLSQITTQNFLTSGLDVIPITDPTVVQNLVLNPASYRLVSAVVRPSEPELDPHLSGGQANIPELRLVYQLVDPVTNRPYDQAFLHLEFDGVDRGADEAARAQQAEDFLARLDQLTRIREESPELADASTAAFIQETVAARPLESLAFSSSLTGIWVFGRLVYDDTSHSLVAERQIRHGVDLGYYSTLYDEQIFRAKAAQAKGPRKAELGQLLESLTPTTYRDPRRNDVNAITFNTVSCAQCHQMSARDGIHVRFNDGLDRRIKDPILATEYLYRELDRQLQLKSAGH